MRLATQRALPARCVAAAHFEEPHAPYQRRRRTDPPQDHAAALELFSRNGYSNTTLAMIAEAAGFSRGPIYWHFKSKDELYEAVLAYSQEPLEQLIEQSRQLAGSPQAALEHFVGEWFRLLLTSAGIGSPSRSC